MNDPSDNGAPPDSGEGVFQRHAEALRRRAQRAEDLGLEHLERGRLLSAVDALREAVDTYRDIGDEVRRISAQQYLALALYEQGEVEQGVSMWEELVRAGWTRPTTLNFLVRHYESIGDRDEIERLYAQLAAAKERNAEFFDDFGAVQRGDEREPTSRASDKPTILIADNDVEVRRVLARMMEFQGYSVLHAEDGEQALSAIFESSPDLILLDIYMPKQSGLDVLYRMRAEKMNTPVVVISGGAYATMVRDAKLLGARFVSKPIKFEELDNVVRELLDLPDRPQRS